MSVYIRAIGLKSEVVTWSIRYQQRYHDTFSYSTYHKLAGRLNKVYCYQRKPMLCKLHDSELLLTPLSNREGTFADQERIRVSACGPRKRPCPLYILFDKALRINTARNVYNATLDSSHDLFYSLTASLGQECMHRTSPCRTHPFCKIIM